MGYGAAMALAEEWSDWCDGPDEAYEILYGRSGRKADGIERITCPVCDKKLKGVDGVIAHAEAKHTKSCHAVNIASFKAMFGRD